MPTSILNKESKEYIQNAIYHKKHILKIFGLTAGLYNTYVQLDYFRPTVRKSTEPGTPNLYSFDDLMKIFHFQLLRDIAIMPELAAKIIMDKNSDNYLMSCGHIGYETDPDRRVMGIKASHIFYRKKAEKLLINHILRTIKLDELEQR